MDPMINQKFSKWLVLSRVKDRSRARFYLCQCECGREIEVGWQRLKRGTSTCCRWCSNIIKSKISVEKNLPNFIGKKFNKWTVLERIKDESNKGFWKCQCECGSIRNIISHGLSKGYTKQCRKCNQKNIGKMTRTHGMSRKIPEYGAWCNIKDRCCNPNCKNWKDYGGRGISICKEWEYDFAKFIRDMGFKPGPKYSIERIDNEKGYSKENCKWIEFSEQVYNKRTTTILEGKKTSITKEAKKMDKCRFFVSKMLKKGLTLSEINNIDGPCYKSY